MKRPKRIAAVTAAVLLYLALIGAVWASEQGTLLDAVHILQAAVGIETPDETESRTVHQAAEILRGLAEPDAPTPSPTKKPFVVITPKPVESQVPEQTIEPQPTEEPSSGSDIVVVTPTPAPASNSDT